MGLSSVMQTALSGLSASGTLLEFAAHNLANSQTPGFKASHVNLATQSYQTRLGGANPMQVGRGVRVSGTTIDFSQGSIEPDDQPALLALEGEGLFILEGPGDERLYTRDGSFALGAAGELLARGGYRVLGYAMGEGSELDTSQLVPLHIALGSQVADAQGQATTLTTFSVEPDGTILGHTSDGGQQLLGQLQLTRFANPGGLVQRAGNAFRASPASGLPIESAPGEQGAAEVVAGATELSNVDIGRELIDLTLAENQFRANLAVWHTADSLLDELFFPWRAW
ncbi:MAG: flagellar hook basal-body protein [Pirellulaceae bacterium]